MSSTLKRASAILLLILILLLGIQTYRLHHEQNAHEASRLQHQKTLLNLQQQAQLEKDKILQTIQTQLKEKNDNINQLHHEIERFTAGAAQSERLQRDLRSRLREAELRANEGSGTDAQEAARVCAKLSAELEARSRAFEHRAAVYARFADQITIELNACKNMLEIEK